MLLQLVASAACCQVTSEEAEGSITEHVLLVNGVSENESSRMTPGHLKNRHVPHGLRGFLPGVALLV